MTRWHLAGGGLAVVVGLASLLAAMVGWLEHGALSNLGVGVVVFDGILILSGLAALGFGLRRWQGFLMPAPVRAAVLGNLLFLGLFALEISDGLVRRGGVVHTMSSTLFPLALVLYCGLLLAQRWAWWTCRGLTAICAIWFLAFIAIIPFAYLQAGGEPTPWYGRIYMMAVSLTLASIMAYVFTALGRPEAKKYFGLLSPLPDA